LHHNSVTCSSSCILCEFCENPTKGFLTQSHTFLMTKKESIGQGCLSVILNNW
jgi:hypothetical protein